MLLKNQRTTILFLSLPLAFTLIFVSVYGFITPDFYYQETVNWQLQSRGQDIVDLILVAPLLILSSIMCTRSYTWWLHVWAAIIVYIIYSFLIYCFAVHFNFLFLFYCIILGLAFYSIVYYISILSTQSGTDNFATTPISVAVGIYLLIISVMFYGLWLSEIIPFMRTDEVPASLKETGLQTNPVHVIDLSVLLPGVFITGIFLLRRKYPGLQLASLLLIFFVIMNITIASLQVMLRDNGLATSISVAWIMSALSILSLVLFILLIRKYPTFQ